MEMEVITPSAAAPMDFNFDSTSTSPYITAPSSPQRFGTFFCSAPTSPTRATKFYAEVPFNWEEKPGIPKSQESLISNDYDHEDEDFAFDFSGQLETSSLSAADELFDGGKIKPLKLKPPPCFQADSLISPKSPRSSSPKKRLKEALSPRHRKIDTSFDPFAAALEQTRRESTTVSDPTTTTEFSNSNITSTQEQQRGRERSKQTSSSSRQKGTRSLSPFRVSDLLLDDHENNNQENLSNKQNSSDSSSSFSWFWYRKLKLKDLLLFRSASEGRKDELKKHSELRKKNEDEDLKNSSFRSIDSVGSSLSSSKRRSSGQISAHELHYTANRAVSEELKKKTFLPYKQGLLGCLGFNPGFPIHEISKIGSMTRARG
ncbi:hypothetical protein ACH5RR_002260 [Cinchona calisaya]|uniref:Calmodulin-binding protein n=1 Tax=Cinchona calisaya TaxID=153742 RepID=A0ABD3B745_9GENT